MTPDPECGPYIMGADNAYHTAERQAETQSLLAAAERFGIRLTLDVAALASPVRGPSERARAHLALLERENAALRREVFDVGTKRERELEDLRIEIRRLQRDGMTAETIARALRAENRATEAASLVSTVPKATQASLTPPLRVGHVSGPVEPMTYEKACALAELAGEDPPDPQAFEPDATLQADPDVDADAFERRLRAMEEDVIQARSVRNVLRPLIGGSDDDLEPWR